MERASLNFITPHFPFVKENVEQHKDLGYVWVPAEVCECIMFAASTELVQLVNRGPSGQVRVGGIRAEVLAGQRGHAGTLRMCVCL